MVWTYAVKYCISIEKVGGRGVRLVDLWLFLVR